MFPPVYVAIQVFDFESEDVTRRGNSDGSISITNGCKADGRSLFSSGSPFLELNHRLKLICFQIPLTASTRYHFGLFNRSLPFWPTSFINLNDGLREF